MAVDKTVPGGLYKDFEGNGWHDANGKPVSDADAKRLLADLKKSLEEPQAEPEVETEVIAEEVALKDVGEKAKKAGK